jgi:hypothetical protein
MNGETPNILSARVQMNGSMSYQINLPQLTVSNSRTQPFADLLSNQLYQYLGKSSGKHGK